MAEQGNESFRITQQEEIAAMRFLVQILFERELITEAERKKILAEYF